MDSLDHNQNSRYFGYLIRSVSSLWTRNEWILPAETGHNFNTYISCLIACGAGVFFKLNLLAKAPCWNFPKRGGDGASQFLLSPIFHCHKIKDGGYNNITNTSKVSPTQNTPALQASCLTALFICTAKPRRGWNDRVYLFYGSGKIETGPTLL